MVTQKKLKGKDQVKKLRDEIQTLSKKLKKQKKIEEQAKDQEDKELQRALEASKIMHQSQNKEQKLLQEAILRSQDDIHPSEEKKKDEPKQDIMPKKEQPQSKRKKDKFSLRPNRALTYEFDPWLRQDQTAEEFGMSELYFGKNGLENLGNTCYMNSVIQSLAGLPEIKKYFLLNGWEPHVIDQGDYDILPEDEMEDLLNTQMMRMSLLHQKSEDLPQRKESLFSKSIEEENIQVPQEKKDHIGMQDSINKIKVKEIKNIEKKSEVKEKQEEEKEPQNPKQINKDQILEESCSKLIKHYDGNFTKSLSEVIRELWLSKSHSLSPDYLYQILFTIVPNFRGFSQQDSAQCLTHILEILHNELNVSIVARHLKQLMPQIQAIKDDSRKAQWTKYWLKNQSIITHLFTGMAVSTLKCEKCKRVESQPQFFNLHSLPLPGNMEYKVKFVPLQSEIRDKLQPLSFQIQINEHQFLTKEVILKKSLEIITHHYPSFKLDKNLISVYEQMQTGKNGMFIEFNEETGLHQEQNCLYILEHSLFQKVDGRLPLNIIPLPVHFQNSLYFRKIQEYIIIPFEDTMTIKEIKGFLNRFVQKRIASNKQRQAVDYMGYPQRREVELDFKIFDNLPVDPKSYTGSTIVCQFCGSSHYQNRNCDLSYRFNESPLQLMNELSGNRQFEIVAHFNYTVSQAKQLDFKKVEDLINPNIEFKKVKLEDCLANSFKPQKLENYACQKCGSQEGQIKELQIYRLPPVLVIQLKRFLVKKNDAFNYYKTLKNNIFVDFPIQKLDMGPYVSEQENKEGQQIQNPKQEGKGQEKKQEAESTLYSLQSVIYHIGSFESGHYYTKRKQMKKNQEDVWVELNDSKAKEVSSSYYIDGLKKELKTPAAYMLIYRRIEKEEISAEAERAAKPPGMLQSLVNIHRKRYNN